MHTPPTCVILDTNVILDCYFADRPHASASVKAVDAALSRDIVLCYAASQAKDVFFLAGLMLKSAERKERGEVSRDAAHAINEACWAILENLDTFATVVGADKTDVWLARKHRGVHADFEDNLVIASAIRANADYLITRDEQLLGHSPVAALAPEAFCAVLETFDEAPAPQKSAKP